MKLYKRNFIDYTLLLLAIAVSGIPYFSNGTLLIPLFLVLFLVFLLRKNRLDWTFVLLLTFLLIITILQTYVFSFYSVQTLAGVFLRVINAYLIVKILGEKFIPYFINIMYGIAIVSFIIYFPILLFPSFKTFLLHNVVPILNVFDIANSQDRTIIIYNLRSIYRNSGPFWEAGAFSGYLIIAFIFNFYSVDKYKIKKGIIFLITIVTTLSTTGYLALFVFLFFAYYKKIKNTLIRIMAIFIILTGGYFAFISFDFLGAKIERQIEFAQKRGIEKSSNSQRFLSILRDLRDFRGHELIGRGANDFTRYDLNPGEPFIIRSVGLTDILVRVGIVFFLYMFYLLYKSICAYLEKLHKNNYIDCLAIFVTILITLMSETYFNHPLFWSFLFLQIIYKKDNTKNIMQTSVKHGVSSKIRGDFEYKS